MMIRSPNALPHNSGKHETTPLHSHRCIKIKSLVKKHVARNNKNQHEHIFLDSLGLNRRMLKNSLKTDQPCQRIGGRINKSSISIWRRLKFFWLSLINFRHLI